MLMLRTIRTERGLSVPELSRRSGVPVRTIEELEKRGDGRISTLYKICAALEILLDDIYTR